MIKCNDLRFVDNIYVFVNHTAQGQQNNWYINFTDFIPIKQTLYEYVSKQYQSLIEVCVKRYFLLNTILL